MAKIPVTPFATAIHEASRLKVPDQFTNLWRHLLMVLLWYHLFKMIPTSTRSKAYNARNRGACRLARLLRMQKA